MLRKNYKNVGIDIRMKCKISTEIPLRLSLFADQTSVSGSSGSAHPVLELNQQRPVFRNYRLLMNGTLFISKASENDEAKFICEADNGVNEPIGKMVTLKINGMCSTLISAPCIHFRFSFRIAISNVYFYFLASP